MSSQQSFSTRFGRRRERAGVFDIRSVIGLLLGIYGAILLVTGLVGTSAEDLAKTDGVNANVWTGVGLLVAAAVFFAWAWLRPLLVPTDGHEEQESGTPPPH